VHSWGAAGSCLAEGSQIAAAEMPENARAKTLHLSRYGGANFLGGCRKISALWHRFAADSPFSFLNYTHFVRSKEGGIGLLRRRTA